MLPINHYIRKIIREENNERDRNRRAIAINRIERRMMRQNSDPLQLRDKKFINLFRLKKEMADHLLQQLIPDMYFGTREESIHLRIRVFVALSFFATGIYQRIIGLNYPLSVSQSAISRIIHEVSGLIVRVMTEILNKFQQTQRQKQHDISRKHVFRVLSVASILHTFLS